MIVRSNLTSSSCLRHVPPSVFILLRHDPDCDGCPRRDQGGRPVGDALEALGRQHPAAAQGRSRGGGQAEAANAPTDGFAASNLMEAHFFFISTNEKEQKKPCPRTYPRRSSGRRRRPVLHPALRRRALLSLPAGVSLPNALIHTPGKKSPISILCKLY